MKSDNEDKAKDKDKDKDKDKYHVYAHLLIAASVYALGYYKGRSQALIQVIKQCTK